MEVSNASEVPSSNQRRLLINSSASGNRQDESVSAGEAGAFPAAAAGMACGKDEGVGALI